MQVTVDPEAGDSITFGDQAVEAHLVSKPSLLNPEETLPAEDVTIFNFHIMAVQHRRREALVLTDSQRAHLAKTLGVPFP
jgi:hypothetical protein